MRMSHCRFWLVICMVISSAMISVYAEFSFWINGNIVDAETGRRIYGSQVEVRDSLSNDLIAEFEDDSPGAQYMMYYGDKAFNKEVYFKDENVTTDAIFKITHKDYKPLRLCLNYPKDISPNCDLDTIWMVPSDSELDAKSLIRLREVTVTATKVKMVINGDTIVYNASAFNLSSGSMLDALIAQLPGVQLSSTGNITVNGEHVSSLLVDGKDFFQGDPTVALRNLPAYTVKNVQVYRKDPYDGRDKLTASLPKEQLPMVMDVRLKPQYQQGFLGNVSVGYGLPRNRYLGRLFGLEYLKNGRISAYAQTNNVNNEGAGPGVLQSDWNENLNSSGQRNVLKTGLDLLWGGNFGKNKYNGWNKSYEIRGNVIYSRIDDNKQTVTSSTQFQPQAQDVFSRSVRKQSGLSHNVNGNLRLDLRNIPYFLSPNLYIYFNMPVTFSTGRGNRISRSAKFNKMPAENKRGDAIGMIFGEKSAEYGSQNDAIYKTETSNSDDSRHFYGAAHFNLHNILKTMTFKGGQTVSHDMNIDLNYTDDKETGELDRIIDYIQHENPGISQIQRSRNDHQDWTMYYSWHLIFGLRDINEHGKDLRLIISPLYSYSTITGNNRLYELENPFQSLTEAILDANNSYFSDQTINKANLRVRLYYLRAVGKYWLNFTMNLDGGLNNTHLIYRRGILNEDISRLRWTYSPDFDISLDDNKGNKMQLNMGLNRSLPSLISMLSTVDNADPLNIYMGNPNLKPATTLNASLSYQAKWNLKERNLKLNLSHSYFWDRRSQYRGYDPLTGVSTFMPVNVSGAYTINGSADFSSRLDRNKRWYLTSSTGASYENIPDWMSLNNNEAELSKVRNFFLSENLRINWFVAEGYDLSIGGYAGWRNASSPLEGFETINTVNLSAKFSANIKLPWKFDFSTDVSYHHRYGYSDSSFNSGNWVWNASIQRSFLQGRLNAKVDAFDILGQIDNISTQINSLGRTETWTNSLHRYVMLSLSYRFSIMPRNAKTALQ